MKNKVYLVFGFVSLITFGAQAQIISTKVGTGVAGYSGDGGPANAAAVHAPSGVALDATGNLYIADQYNHCIRMVNPSGVISTIAGNDTAGFSGDGGPAKDAKLNKPYAVSVDAAGNVYIADQGNNRIRKISGGTITTIAGTGVAGYNGDNDTAKNASLNHPTSAVADADGNVYISDQLNNRIRKINTDGIISTIVGTGVSEFNGDIHPFNTMVAVNKPGGLAISPSGELHFADTYNNLIRKIDKVTGKVATVQGIYARTPYIYTNMQLHWPSSIAFDQVGNMYIADEYYYWIKKLDTADIYYNICGTTAGYSGDEGRAEMAQISQVKGIAADAQGNVIIADWGNDRIRYITTTVGTKTINRATVGVSVSPNPAASGNFNVNINTPSVENVAITVTDVTGRTVFTTSTETNKTLKVSLQQPSGVYMLTATIGSETFSEKVVVE